MSERPPSIFRDAMQVSPARVARLTDVELRELMEDLLGAQAHLCGSPTNEVRVSPQEKAKDEGCDAWTALPAVPDAWLGDGDTCWQLKSGTAGEPEKLKGEVLKPIPMQTLKSGGRFVVIASGAMNSRTGERKRKQIVVTEARAHGIPDTRIEVICADRLARWCNEHPAIAARWAGRNAGFVRLNDWERFDEHRVPWQAPAAINDALAKKGNELDFKSGALPHLHIFGPSGVGKTRRALELCRVAPWAKFVVYVQQPDDAPVAELLGSIANDAGARIVVVVDESRSSDLLRYRNLAGLAPDRIRLITIGHEPSPDSKLVPAIAIAPLDDDSMKEVIAGWGPSLPPEHVRFIVKFAGGFVRLARLTTNAVAEDPTLNVRDLLRRDEISGTLDRLLGAESRKGLYVLAALTVVGWVGEPSAEGRAIAEHLNFDWRDVCLDVDRLHHKYKIAPFGGRYRYLSPMPLGNYLALEAWSAMHDDMETLPEALPTDGARQAYFERVELIASSPNVASAARKQLGFFFSLDHFTRESSVRRWAALSAADPERAAEALVRAIDGTDISVRARIRADARTVLVATLVRLAWGTSTFFPATRALALLAEAENQDFANNSTAEFRHRFSIFMGGTAVPYVERLSLVDHLIAGGGPSRLKLAVLALKEVGESGGFRIIREPISEHLPEAEWRPRSQEEHFECYAAAFSRLTRIAKLGVQEVRGDLTEAGLGLARLLRDRMLRGLVREFLEAIRDAYSDAREPLRRAVESTLYWERQFGKELPESELDEIEELHSAFRGSSFQDRLVEIVGTPGWDREEPVDMSALAEEILSNPSHIREHAGWLASGEATEAWRLGNALGAVDDLGELLETLESVVNAGPDDRLYCGYLCERRARLGDAWYDSYIESMRDRGIRFSNLIVVIAWRCGGTPNLARLVAEIIEKGEATDAAVGQLAFANWEATLGADDLRPLLETLLAKGFVDTAVVILARRLERNPSELALWKPIAVELSTNGSLIRNWRMANFHWQKIAAYVIADSAREIAAAIFREHGRRSDDPWFLEHSQSVKVLLQCAENDPSGVWEELREHLEPRQYAHRFAIGFPRTLLSLIPAQELMGWIGEAPSGRASAVAGMVEKDLSNDDKLAAQILGTYGDDESVGSAFFSELISGAWSGPSSVHWEKEAAALEKVIASTALPKLRRWATNAAKSLRQMSASDREREEEERLRGI